MDPGTKFNLRLFGYPQLSASDGRPVSGLGPGKPLAMLAYLCVRGVARRDELVDLLWGEVGEANARNAFRQALHRLRTALGDEIIPMDREVVELNLAAGVESDRQGFIEALDRGDIAVAVEAYRADFLDGFELGETGFDSWADAERTRLRGRFQSALHTGAESALAAGRWLEALQYVQRLTVVAPYDEDAVLLEANVLVAADRGSEALKALRRYAQTLEDQLDLKPSAKVREMLTRIERADQRREAAPDTRSKEIPFVGREHEIAMMMGFVRGLSAERGSTILVEGAAGVGKTRLVAEFVRRSRALGPLLVLRGRERATTAALPYASVAEALRGALRAPGVAGTGRHLLTEAARILPELRDAFDLPEPSPIDAEGGRLRFFEGIAALLDSAAYEQPVCLVLDDMHNASPSTIDLVGYLGARLQSSPVLIILMQREVGDGSPIARLVGGAPADAAPNVVRVAGLPDEAAGQLVAHVVGAAVEAGPLDIAGVVSAAGGNPLRAIELARRLLDGEQPASLPASLRDVLWARFQKASPSQRRVFFAAALLDRPSSLRLMASASHLPETTTFEAAQSLERWDLLMQEGDAFVVAHDFTTSFVVETSGLAGRALLASWAADALGAEPAPPHDELAALYATAGEPGKAFDHARLAVYRASMVGDTPELHRLLALSLALAPDTAARERVQRMSAAFGAGRPLLAETVERNADPIVEPPEPDAGAAPAEAVARHLDVRPDWRRAFLTPRLAALVIIGGVLLAAALAWRHSIEVAAGPRVMTDSLVLRDREDTSGALVVTGPLASISAFRSAFRNQPAPPAWFRAPSLPWIRPVVSPLDDKVAMEKVTSTGSDIYLADSVTPMLVVAGGGVNAVLGWSPDGNALLVRRGKLRPDGAFDADLWAFRVSHGAVTSQPIDTSGERSVEEAAWSPDGLRIAWVARVGASHQRDIFLSSAGGGEVQPVTETPAEDYHITWSSDGNLLAFTSDRDGNADLFAMDFERDPWRLWRLTSTPGDEDNARFSPDSRFVAFQSTASGDAAVYVMPALGGQPTRVTPAGGQYSIAGWRGQAPESFVDRFRIIGPASARTGDSIVLTVFGAERSGKPKMPETAELHVVDSAAGSLVRRERTSDSASRWIIRAQRAGTIRVAAAIPGWRFDTLDIVVDASSSADLGDDFAQGISATRWRVLGSPLPFIRRGANNRAVLYPNGDLEWQSGLLGRRAIGLADSLSLGATFVAAFGGKGVEAAMLILALVDEDALTGGDSLAPQIRPVVGVAWDGEAGRLNYSVGSESKSDPLSALGTSDSHDVRIVVSRDGAVRFFVGDRLRWTSSLRFLGTSANRRARVWLGGRATGDQAGFRGFRLVQGR